MLPGRRILYLYISKNNCLCIKTSTVAPRVACMREKNYVRRRERCHPRCLKFSHRDWFINIDRWNWKPFLLNFNLNWDTEKKTLNCTYTVHQSFAISKQHGNPLNSCASAKSILARFCSNLEDSFLIDQKKKTFDSY